MLCGFSKKNGQPIRSLDELTVKLPMTTDTTEHTLESLSEQIPWVVNIETPWSRIPEDVAVVTHLNVITMDEHFHTLTNYGLMVERIRYRPSCGMVFYCQTHS